VATGALDQGADGGAVARTLDEVIRWCKMWADVSNVLIGEHIGPEKVDDGQWDVYPACCRLSRVDERFMRIEGSLSQLKRRV
jgi:hypothetical protein